MISLAAYLLLYLGFACVATSGVYTFATSHGLQSGFVMRKGSFWIGAHYSDYNRRWCINFLPCVTVWVVLPGGTCPGDHK